MEEKGGRTRGENKLVWLLESSQMTKKEIRKSRAWKNAVKAARHSGVSEVIIKLSDGRLVHAPRYSSSLGAALAVAMACGAQVVDEVIVLK